jgi:catechol 2,3-dioxygenase-like lactoylglutathione lyase family enzyme
MEGKEEVVALKIHVALNVTDVNRSTEFYKRLFGVAPAKERAGYAKFDVQNPPVNFTLNQIGEITPGALSHLGIQVGSTADVLLTKQRWIDAGLTPRDEMQTNCCYALQDKTWIQDPDGNQWEVFVVLADNLPSMNACCGTDTTGPIEIRCAI